MGDRAARVQYSVPVAALPDAPATDERRFQEFKVTDWGMFASGCIGV